MKVDRTRFLLLTTALSAATAVGAMATGCSITNTTTDAGTTPGTTDGGVDTDATADAAYVDGGDGGDGGACLGDEGLPPSCATASASCATVCADVATNYKNAVGRAIVDCLLALPTCESALNDRAACFQAALGRACSDTTAATECTPIVAACDVDGGAVGDGGTSVIAQTECVDLLTGLNATGRATFTTCTQEIGPGTCSSTANLCIGSMQ
jgi:hypothetical protein